nr:tRNA (adenosine(37)-N6)-threonylcarbamoyltransferase complex dimerization subunit type 1 TsaB [Periweissella fabalis]
MAIDTSNQPLAVALYANGQVLAHRETNQSRNHSLQLLPLIVEMMQTVGWQPAELDRIVVAQGPGSYTGVRIGVTTAKTLATTLNIELVGVSSLMTLAANIDNPKVLVVPIFDARNDNLYSAVYQDGQVIWPDKHTNINDLIAFLTTTSGAIRIIGEYEGFAERLATIFGSRVSFGKDDENRPQGARLAQIGSNMVPILSPHLFVPNYLRVSQAEADWQAAHPNEIGQNYVEEVN